MRRRRCQHDGTPPVENDRSAQHLPRVFCAGGPATHCKSSIQAPMGIIPGAWELGGAPARIAARRGGNGHGRSSNTHKRGALPPCIHPSSGAAARNNGSERTARSWAAIVRKADGPFHNRTAVSNFSVPQMLATACGKGGLSAHDSLPAIDPMQNKPNRRCVQLKGADIAESQKQHRFGCVVGRLGTIRKAMDTR